MTFNQYILTHGSKRALHLVMRYGITEFTPYSHVIQCGGIGRHSSRDIEQLQQDYIKTFDGAYQQVIHYIRNEMIS